MIGLIKAMRREGHGVGVVALQDLEIIRDWVFLVPRYKNDLGKHVSWYILVASSRKSALNPPSSENTFIKNK